MTLIDYSIFCSFDSNDLVSSFSDDKDGNSSVLDFTIFCLRYDDIVHKEDSIGYHISHTYRFNVRFYNRTLPSFHTSVFTFLPFFSATGGLM
jgi:hypothetical protein